MQVETTTTISIGSSELLKLLREAIRLEVEIFRKKVQPNREPKVYTRKETAILLKIDLSTLWEWTRDKKINAKKIGRRVYYMPAEINRCLEKSTEQ